MTRPKMEQRLRNNIRTVFAELSNAHDRFGASESNLDHIRACSRLAINLSLFCQEAEVAMSPFDKVETALYNICDGLIQGGNTLSAPEAEAFNILREKAGLLPMEGITEGESDG